MTSHQTGPILQHWNDPPLDFTYSASSSRSGTPAGVGTPSHASQLQTKYANNSTLSLAVNVGSRAASRPGSSVGFRTAGGGEAAAMMTAAYVADQEQQGAYETLAPGSFSSDGPGFEEEGEGDSGNAMQVDPPSFDGLLTRLFALPSAMPDAERELVEERLRKHLPGVTDEQKEELGWVLREVVEGRQEGATWGREMVVKFMKEWVGRGDVSRWSGGLRRVVETLRTHGGGRGDVA
ncbi:MAG: hypothetical protein M1813_008075 [Trichoglossum hirsutum]|nr:MAG: hypothetical protein M1813_008075 [Trichoglossum hirsutum]